MIIRGAVVYSPRGEYTHQITKVKPEETLTGDFLDAQAFARIPEPDPVAARNMLCGHLPVSK